MNIPETRRDAQGTRLGLPGVPPLSCRSPPGLPVASRSRPKKAKAGSSRACLSLSQLPGTPNWHLVERNEAWPGRQESGLSPHQAALWNHLGSF